MSWALVALRARVVSFFCLPEQIRSVERTLVVRLRDLMHALTVLHSAAAIDAAKPALATITILCERHIPGDVGWVPSFLGGEVWLSPGQSHDMQIFPQVPIRNLRWFLSGSPDIVCQGLIVANEAANAAFGGTKFGDWQGEVRLGNAIRVRLERKALPS